MLADAVAFLQLCVSSVRNSRAHFARCAVHNCLLGRKNIASINAEIFNFLHVDRQIVVVCSRIYYNN